MGGDERLERRPLLAGGESVERLTVLADVVVDVEEDRRGRLELGKRARGDDDDVADAAGLDQHRAVEPSFEHLAAQRPDHRAPPRSLGDAPLQRRHRQVAQRQRGGVGGVGGPGRAVEAKPRLHHLLHLLLGRPAPSGDGVLHLVRAVLGDLAPGGRGLGEGEPAGLPDAHRGAHVDLEEQLLDRHRTGPVLGDERGQLAAQGGETVGDAVGGRGADDPEGDDRGGTRAAAVDDGVAAAGEAGIDAEDARRLIVCEHRFAD